MKQIIAPYDNTGYRTYTGVSLHVFNTYEEAVEQYNSMLGDVIATYKKRIEVINSCIAEALENKL